MSLRYANHCRVEGKSLFSPDRIRTGKYFTEEMQQQAGVSSNATEIERERECAGSREASDEERELSAVHQHHLGPGFQPPDPSTVPLRAEDLRHGDTGGYGETLPLRDCQIRRGDAGKLSAGHRRGETTVSVLMQNGGGEGGRIAGAERDLQLQLLKKHSNQKQQKDWDKLRFEEKEAEINAKKVSKNIDRALKEQKREYKQTHRLLLLESFVNATEHRKYFNRMPNQSSCLLQAFLKTKRFLVDQYEQQLIEALAMCLF
ncbi:hypothetical protein EOD39_8559 [Acipenser ruthenus]|uniref:Uncharacterized protein n=1 Tax=Acipenser ruthenus TaxID=7906 RepID=A0A444U3J1_ACIRT|nr:hypothetical protein EOD39_8559 [Acipenser ruthenus]